MQWGMSYFPDILVFSDLDGTLLDHRDYSWAAALPALRALRQRGAGLVLATSKTAAEVAPLRARIGFEDWPAIVENGAGVLETGSDADDAPVQYDRLRACLRDLPEGFEGFGDMSAETVAGITGLSVTAARLAKTRHFTEPGLWHGSPGDLEEFLAAAREVGVQARRGGRFLTLSFGGTKADRMEDLIRRFGPRVTLALGDAPNDVEMLERADWGVIVANSATAPLPMLDGEATGRIRRTRLEGPRGWCEAVTDFLNEHEPAEDTRQHG